MIYLHALDHKKNLYDAEIFRNVLIEAQGFKKSLIPTK